MISICWYQHVNVKKTIFKFTFIQYMPTFLDEEYKTNYGTKLENTLNAHLIIWVE
jgi:hypothetical protein